MPPSKEAENFEQTNVPSAETPETSFEAAARPSAEQIRVERDARLSQLEQTIDAGEESVDHSLEELGNLKKDLGIPETGENPPGINDDREAVERFKEAHAKELGEKNEEERRAWYEKAKSKAEEFLAKSDPDMRVEVVKVDLTLNDGTDLQGAYALKFSSETDPSMRWTMSVGDSDEYLNGVFEGVLKKSIAEKRAGGAGAAMENLDARDGVGSFDPDAKYHEMEAHEREKTAEEQAMVKDVDAMTNDLLARLGLPPVTLSESSIHFIKEEGWKESGSAMYVEETRQIFIRDAEKQTILKKKLIHETLHSKSANMLPGMLNEALVESLTKSLIENSAAEAATLAKEKLDSKMILETNANHRALDGSPLFDSETFLGYVGNDGRLHAESFTYREERAVLEALTKKIAEREKTFTSPAEVSQALARASFSGNREALRFVDKALGAGTLDKIQKEKDPKNVLKLIEKL
ncbi:MAG: hypothetical protein WC866_06355 [Patescibacteria group bacterium]|jgi:hypothetical protein